VKRRGTRPCPNDHRHGPPWPRCSPAAPLAARREALGENEGKETLKIDDDVLHPLLWTESDRPGIRSMEALITMSALVGERSFDRRLLLDLPGLRHSWSK
jgi:hypothetical protein